LSLSLLILFLFYPTAIAREVPPPDWSKAKRYGCRIEQFHVRYRVTVWVRYQTDPARGDDWSWIESMHAPEPGQDVSKARLQAMKSCDAWMKKAEKEIRKARPEESGP
jgi:hypothetical protein